MALNQSFSWDLSFVCGLRDALAYLPKSKKDHAIDPPFCGSRLFLSCSWLAKGPFQLKAQGTFGF